MESGGRDGGELGGSFAALSVRTAAAEPWAARSSRVRREDWRRAIVLREVLGPPLALRSADSDLASLR
jgi:hypothetical protein